MSDETEINRRHTAYVDRIRQLGRRERYFGLVASLVGVVVMVLGRFRFGGQPVALWGGLAIVGVGWALLVWAMASRYLWMRAHPFDPNVTSQG